MTERNQAQAPEKTSSTEEQEHLAVAEPDFSTAEDASLPEQESVVADPPAAQASPAQDPRKAAKLAEMIPSQLASLRQHHYAVVTTDGVEAVHKMRVTTRRLQASLDLLEGKVKVRPLKRRLRRWRRMLSSVRNYDVFLLMIEQEAASRRGAREQYELLTIVIQKRRAKLAASVKKYLAKVDVVEQLGTRLSLSSATMSRLWEQPVTDEVDATVEVAADFGDASAIEPGDSLEPEATFPAIDEQAAAMRAAERLEQRMAEFNALAARSHPTTDPYELHQLRIAAKRVRYLLEAVTAMGFGEATQALTWLRALQDRIGDWHDLEALEDEILRLVSRRRFTKDHLKEAAGLLLAAMHLQKRKKLLVSRLFPVRVPAGLSATSRRLVRALRRSVVSRPHHGPHLTS